METARWSFSGPGFNYLVAHEIQWHVSTMMHNYGDFDLLVVPSESARGTLSSRMIAASAVRVLISAMGVPVKAGGQEAITVKVAEDIDTYGLLGSRGFRVSLPADFVRGQFEPDVFESWSNSVHDQLRDQLVISPMIAAGDLGGRATGTSRQPSPRTRDTGAWARERARQLRALIARVRAEGMAPANLPDDATAEPASGSGAWNLRVWAQFGAERGHRVSQVIPLRRDEPVEDLLERARAAVDRALQRDADRQQKERARSAPAWARDLVRELERRLAAVRKAEPSATDVPDGVALAVAPQLELRVWVERGSAEGPKERNTGSVPLTPQASAQALVPYVRKLAAVLRQFENVPGAAQDHVEVNLDPQSVNLAAFPAHLEPVDLRQDKMTVTGARNAFSMVLDFEAVYGFSPLGDLYIASKLYAQRLHFFWEVYRVPDDLPSPAGSPKAPTEWGRRWQWTYEMYNPPGVRTAADAAALRLRLGPAVTKTDGSELTSRVDFPEAAGDYVVRCVTGHAPVGPDQVRRLSSEAYYPVRVQPIKDVAAATANSRTQAITLAEQELKSIETELASPASPERQAMLRAQQQYRSAYLARLRRKETLTLGEGTAEELAFTQRTLTQVKQLAAMEPRLKEAARASKVTPSSLITDPDLLTLYWFIIAEGKTIEGYQRELTGQADYLSGLAGRAREFGNELKAGSPYQYSVTAGFVSELTGQVYPLVFMLGEAPAEDLRASSARAGVVPQVVYALVDVTDRRTQKRYHGMSFQSGPAGHREAIDRAFGSFGEDATYGEGIVAVHIPPGRAGTNDPNHPGTATKYYRSAEGPLQKVLWALGIIAAVAGLAALAATGVGAPAAAAVLGLVAGVAGTITSAHNISERAARHTLAFDAELALDIIGIVGVIPAAQGARMALAARAAGFATATRAGTFLRFYGYAETGATVILVPVKMADDIHRIESDPSLDDEQKKRLIEEAKLGAFQAGLMVLGSAAAARMGGHAPGTTAGAEAEAPGLQRQIELLELEGFGKYESLKERGYLDAHGEWTEAAHQRASAPAEQQPGTSAPARPPEAPGALPRSAPVETPIGGHPHRVQYREGSLHMCTDCQHLVRRLAQLEIIVPEYHPSYDAIEALSLEVSSLQQAAAEGRLSGDALDARVQSVSDRLQAIANEAPPVAKLLNLDGHMLDKLAILRAEHLRAAAQAEGAGPGVKVDLDPEFYSFVENRPPVIVSPTRRGVTRGRLKQRMIAAGMAPGWAHGDPALWNPHHVIPVELENHPVLNELRAHEPGWDHNAPVNGYPLPIEPGVPGVEPAVPGSGDLPVHQVTSDVPRRGNPPPPTPETARDLAGHPVWNAKVRARLDALAVQPSKAVPGELLINRPDELRSAVLDLIIDLKGEIELSQARGIPVLF